LDDGIAATWSAVLHVIEAKTHREGALNQSSAGADLCFR
jgi:hypothetical protein